MIKTISVRELRSSISKVLDDVDSKFSRYVVCRGGRPEAVLLSLDDYDSLLETISIETDAKLMQRLAKAEKEISSKRGKSLEALNKELGIV